MTVEKLRKFTEENIGLRFAAARFRGLAWNLKPVSEPGFRQNIARMRGILLDFLAYLRYHRTNLFGFFPIIGPPDGLQNLLIRDRFPLLNHQSAQDFKFFRSHVRPVASNIDDSSV